MLGDDGNDGEKGADEAVLEDAEPDNLVAISKGNSPIPRRLTLNQVRPLRGLRSQPLSSPPVHFCIHVTGHTQFFGCTPLKYSFCSCRFGAM